MLGDEYWRCFLKRIGGDQGRMWREHVGCQRSSNGCSTASVVGGMASLPGGEGSKYRGDGGRSACG